MPWQILCCEICRILPSVRRELRNMIEGDRAASRPLCQSPVHVIVSWENHSIPRVVAGPGKIPQTESGTVNVGLT